MSRFLSRLVCCAALAFLVLDKPVPAAADVQPTGQIENAYAPQVTGWASDPDFTGPIAVHLYIQYNGTGPFVFLTSATANVTAGWCPAAYQGHCFTIPYGALGDWHKLYVFAINVDSAGNPVGNNPLVTNSGAVAFNRPIAQETGIYVTDSDPACPDKPVKLDVLVRQSSASPWVLHNTGYTNPPVANDSGSFFAYIPFKYALPGNGTFAGSDIQVRRWKRTSCSSDTWQDEATPATFSPAGAVAMDAGYRIGNHGIVMESQARPAGAYPGGVAGTPTYRVRADRNGGAFYEYCGLVNVDPSVPAGTCENAVHAHFGGALQIAHHSGNPPYGYMPVETPAFACDRAGTWNPTQAGAACRTPGTTAPLSPEPGHPDSQLQIKCGSAGTPGGGNNGCPAGTNVVEWGAHRMVNWDYSVASGRPYVGPYKLTSDGDQAFLTQTVYTTNWYYMLVDITLKNNGSVERPGPLEIPTFYFTNRWRRFYFPNQWGFPQGYDFSPLPNAANHFWAQMAGEPHPGHPPPPSFCYDPGWVTVENTAPDAANKYITIAWFYKNSFINNPAPAEYFPACGPGTSPPQSRWATQIAEDPLWHTIKFWNAPHMRFSPNEQVEFRYVIFPFKYDDHLDATTTVLDMINALRSAFQS